MEATFIAMDTVTVSYVYTKDIIDILDKDPSLYSVNRTFARLRRNWLANAKSVSETWRKVRIVNGLKNTIHLHHAAVLPAVCLFISSIFQCI